MRNAWRVFAFDIAAPLAAIGALMAIGVVLAWPPWWVSACSVLLLLIVEAVMVNVWLARRDSVTVGTDDDAPWLRFVVVALCTVAVVAAVLTGYTHWSSPDRRLKADMARVVGIATEVAEATSTSSPNLPRAPIDRTEGLLVPEFKDQFAKALAELARRHVTASASTLDAGVEAIGPSAASVAVVLRASQNAPGQPASNSVLALRVALTKQSDHWLVLGVAQINAR